MKIFCSHLFFEADYPQVASIKFHRLYKFNCLIGRVKAYNRIATTTPENKSHQEMVIVCQVRPTFFYVSATIVVTKCCIWVSNKEALGACKTHPCQAIGIMQCAGEGSNL